MTRLHEISLLLIVALFGMSAAVFATEAGSIGNQPTVSQEAKPQGSTAQGGTSASREKAGKKSNQDVKSRGLFKKKKKKQKGAAAGHSQPSDSIGPGAESDVAR